jgi:hypothetical protein
MLVLGLLTGFIVAAPAIGAQEADEKADAFAEVTAPERQPVQVYVENSNFLDMDIFAVRGATRIRLGTVGSQQGRFFDLPASAVESGQQLQLLADPVGSRRAHRSGTIMINPGDVVEWRLGNSLNQSTLAVWST